MPPEHLSELLDLLASKVLTTSLAKSVFEQSFTTGKAPSAVVQEKGLAQITDTSSIERAVVKALDANPPAVADYLNGKQMAIKFLTGQVMMLTKGKANPELVNLLLKEKMEAM